MTRPARQSQKVRIFALQRRQSWVVLALIILSVGMDVVLGQSLLIAKSLALGVLLAYIAQSAFTIIAYKKEGAKARQAVMLNMYLGQMIKWLITLIGFALIFIVAKPVVAPLVVAGYFIMQVVHIVMTWRFLS